jgi:hypothetical protein
MHFKRSAAKAFTAWPLPSLGRTLNWRVVAALKLPEHPLLVIGDEGKTARGSECRSQSMIAGRQRTPYA